MLEGGQRRIEMDNYIKVIHEFYYAVGYRDFSNHYALKVNRETKKMLYGHAFNDKEEKCDNFAVNKGNLNLVQEIIDRKYGLVCKIQIEASEKEDARIKAKNIIYNYLLEIAEDFKNYNEED
jgi:hypothetical protein